MKILKTVIKEHKHQAVSLPVGAVIMTVQMDKGQISLWYLSNDKLETETVLRYIWVFSTDETLPAGEFTYISTVQPLYGSYILHIFEKKEV